MPLPGPVGRNIADGWVNHFRTGAAARSNCSRNEYTAHFLALGHYDAHVVRMREEMKRRRSETIDALTGTSFCIAGTARDGGASIWLSAPEGMDSLGLAERARDRGVLIEPGAVFFEAPPLPCPFFRLGYGSIPLLQIRRGLQQLQKACDDLLNRPLFRPDTWA